MCLMEDNADKQTISAKTALVAGNSEYNPHAQL